MLLEEARDRALQIIEDLEDAEVAQALLARLTWDVLVTIATGKCKDAPPKDFAAVVLDAELAVHDAFGSTPDHYLGVRERLEAQKPAGAKAKFAPTKPNPAKKFAAKSKKPGRKELPRATSKKRK